MFKPFRSPFFFLRFLPFVILFIFLAGFATMSLWNWLVPTLFHGPLINYWQAMGVLLLSKILFGGRPFGGGRWGGRHGGGGPMMWRQKVKDHMAYMTPDERTAFKAKMQKRCGGRFEGWFEEEEKPKEPQQA